MTESNTDFSDFWDGCHSKPDPNMVNLDNYKSVTFRAENGAAAIYDVEIVKWLIENRSRDYFVAKGYFDDY